MIAVDLAEKLLNKGSQRAAEQGLTNIEFRSADLESLPFPDRTFDTVLCVFGIFFVTDSQGGIRELWRLVRPNGLLAITIWGRDLFELADGIFRQTIRKVNWAHWDSKWMAAAFSVLSMFWLLIGRSFCRDKGKWVDFS